MTDPTSAQSAASTVPQQGPADDPFGALLDDLRAEYAHLDAVLGSLTDQQWMSPSRAPGWTVRDVMVHLASSEEGVSATLTSPSDKWQIRDRHLDAVMGDDVARDSARPAAVLQRWRAAITASLAALGSADPEATYRWAAAPLRPRTLATTRLAEHWAHTLDICEPLGIVVPETARLRHIAWLGHATLPYAFGLDGLGPVPVRCDLDGPDGARWAFGPSDADARISGSAAMFCRVGARRIPGEQSGLKASNADAVAALRVLRNYAV